MISKLIIFHKKLIIYIKILVKFQTESHTLDINPFEIENIAN